MDPSWYKTAVKKGFLITRDGIVSNNVQTGREIESPHVDVMVGKDVITYAGASSKEQHQKLDWGLAKTRKNLLSAVDTLTSEPEYSDLHKESTNQRPGKAMYTKQAFGRLLHAANQAHDLYIHTPELRSISSQSTSTNDLGSHLPIPTQAYSHVWDESSEDDFYGSSFESSTMQTFPVELRGKGKFSSSRDAWILRSEKFAEDQSSNVCSDISNQEDDCLIFEMDL